MELYSGKQEKNISEKVIPYAQIFLWFGLGIVLTGGVGFGLAFWIRNSELSSIMTTINVMTIISAILVFPLSLVLNFKAMDRNSSAVPICYFLYCLAFGVLLSSALAYVDASLALYAFLVTGGIMLVMGILGVLIGPGMNKLMMFAGTLFFGAIIISLINVFFFNQTIYWITTMVMFGAIMIMTAYDVYRMKKIVEMGNVSRNLAIFCAYTLYSDFIFIFIRVLLILSRNK